MIWNEEKYPNWDENHKHDYRWIKNKNEKKEWIEEHYTISGGSEQK